MLEQSLLKVEILALKLQLPHTITES